MVHSFVAFKSSDQTRQQSSQVTADFKRLKHEKGGKFDDTKKDENLMKLRKMKILFINWQIHSVYIEYVCNMYIILLVSTIYIF